MTPDERDEIAAKNDEILRAYSTVFGAPAGRAVLADLTAFCRATESTVVRGDRQASDVLAGRREVFLRIQRFAGLSLDEILRLRAQRVMPETEGDDE